MKEKIKNLKLLPYFIDDGIPTMTDSFIISLLDQAEEEGTINTLFYGDSKATKQGFLFKIKGKESKISFRFLPYVLSHK